MSWLCGILSRVSGFVSRVSGFVSVVSGFVCLWRDLSVGCLDLPVGRRAALIDHGQLAVGRVKGQVVDGRACGGLSVGRRRPRQILRPTFDEAMHFHHFLIHASRIHGLPMV